MIGDDEVEAEALGFGRGSEGADAGVDGDDQAHTFGGGVSEAGLAQAVAFAEAMGDVEADVGGGVERGGGALKGGLQQNGWRRCRRRRSRRR